MAMQEFQSAADVLEHYKAVKRRTMQWRRPPRRVEIVEPEPEPVPIPVQVAAPPEPEIPPHLEAPEIKYPSVRLIIELVCAKYAVPKIDLLSQRRHQKLVRPRQIVMYLARHQTLRTLPEIGKAMNDRDHSTILHGVRKITRIREADPAFSAELADLEAVLQKAMAA